MNSVRDIFNSFSVNDSKKAEIFYSEVLGLSIRRDSMGLTLYTGEKKIAFIYQKEDHQPATFTILNFVVENLNDVLIHLNHKGLKPEIYEGLTDSGGVHKGNPEEGDPYIAWFKDPAGNIFSIIQENNV